MTQNPPTLDTVLALAHATALKHIHEPSSAGKASSDLITAIDQVWFIVKRHLGESRARPLDDLIQRITATTNTN